MPSQLLRDLIDVGHEMQIALQGDDLDEYVRLVEERGTLLDMIMEHQHPSEIDPNWEEMAAALSEQSAELIAAAEAQRDRMQDALAKLSKVKGAQRSYRQPAGQRNILNENLRV